VENPFDGSSFLDLLADLEWIQMFVVGDVHLYSVNFRGSTLEDLVKEIIKVLENSKGILTVEEIVKILKKTNEFKNLEIDLTEFVRKCTTILPNIEERITNGFALYSDPFNKWGSLIIKVLEEESSPLHFTEISDRVNKMLVSEERHLEHRRTHSILIEKPEFAHSGIRGTYGLVKWGLKKESTTELIRKFIKDAGFPVHWEQIYYYVSKYKDSPKMNIRSVLDFSGKFVNKGNGFYFIKGAK
jgi:predicted Zn-ribbon and HTH transcriptional regulator